jgi:hypothetical protein
VTQGAVLSLSPRASKKNKERSIDGLESLAVKHSLHRYKEGRKEASKEAREGRGTEGRKKGKA